MTVFEENEIDLNLLAELDHNLPKDMGVSVGGHRLAMLKAAQQHDAGGDSDTSETAAEEPSSAAISREAEPR